VRAPARRRRPAPPAEPPPPDPPAPPAISLVDPAPAIGVLALARATGKTIAGPVLARGWWPARDGSGDLELATAAGIERRPRDLAPGRMLDDAPVVGALLDRRGDERLVAGPPVDARGPMTLYLLDRRGVRAVIAAPARTAALGTDHVLAAATGDATWLALPAGRPRTLPLSPTPPPRPPVHRLELPPAAPADPAGAIAGPGGDTVEAVVATRIDPLDPAAVWVVGRSPAGGVLARLDLRARRWTVVTAGCPAGTPFALAIAAPVIACAAVDASGDTPRGTVTAIRRDGGPAWQWTGGPIDAVTAAGDAIVLAAGDRTIVLDAATGEVVDDRRSDDGLAASMVPVQIGGATAIVTLERGAVVARAFGAPLAPLWAAAPRGQVTSVAATPDDAIVVLDGADLYRLDLPTGAARAIAAAADRWTVAGDLVIGEASVEDGWAVRAFDRGGERFRTAVAAAGPFALAAARAASPRAPVVVVHGPAEAIVLDAATGALVAHIALPERTASDAVFATVVDGLPVAGAVVPGPLAALTF